VPNIDENWKCPYCGHAQVITDARYEFQSSKLDSEGWEVGEAAYWLEAICAPTQNVES
jgi:hypothetical protein